MPELNVNLPPIEVLVQKEYLYGDGTDGLEPAVLISAASVPGQPLLFQVLLKSGALYERLPVEALRHTPYDELCIYADGGQLWDCPGPNITFTEYETLADSAVKILPRAGTSENARDFLGRYVGTFDWWGSYCSDGVGEYGHKAAHFIAAGDGTYWLLPNDYLLFRTKVWSPEADATKVPRLQRNRERYSCEGLGWRTPEKPVEKPVQVSHSVPVSPPTNKTITAHPGLAFLAAYNTFCDIPEGWKISHYAVPKPGDWVWEEQCGEPVLLLSCDPPRTMPTWIFTKCYNK